jgi:integrase
LLLFTGARRSNVAEMRWDEIDLERAVWRIPRTKNGRPQMVPLVPPALNILKSRRETSGESPWVFPADTAAEGHVVDPRKAWERVRARAGLHDLRMHDLRRSLGSWAAAAGTSLAIIGAALGHRDLKSTQVYSRLQLDVVRAAVEKTTAAMLEAGNVANGNTVNVEVPSDADD